VRSAPCTWRRGAHVSWLSLKTKVDGLSVVWPQNHWDGFSHFGLKTGGEGFSGLCLKISSYSLMICASKSPRWFFVWASKPCRLSLSVAPQNRWEGIDVGHASRSSGLCHGKASQARVSQSGLKTGVGVTTGGTRGTIVEVVSESS
jgi:hypothetical protein